MNQFLDHPKRSYVAPKINRILLDNEISIVMLTLPPDDGVKFSFINLAKLPFGLK